MMRNPTLALCLLAASAAVAEEAVERIYAAAAGADLEALRTHVEALSELAEARLARGDVEQALREFREAPWRRTANGLHLWGVTEDGLSWFDAGHPELEGLNTSEMTDIEGRSWARLAWDSATGAGASTFMIVFPHPESQRPARGLHRCFLLADDQRALCAGGFEDHD